MTVALELKVEELKQKTREDNLNLLAGFAIHIEGKIKKYQLLAAEIRDFADKKLDNTSSIAELFKKDGYIPPYADKY